MMFDVNEYAQFHPRSAFELRAVVDAKRNTPVETGSIHEYLSSSGQEYSPDASESVPLRPRYGTSTRYPPMMAPGTPMTERMTRFRL